MKVSRARAPLRSGGVHVRDAVIPLASMMRTKPLVPTHANLPETVSACKAKPDAGVAGVATGRNDAIVGRPLVVSKIRPDEPANAPALLYWPWVDEPPGEPPPPDAVIV